MLVLFILLVLAFSVGGETIHLEYKRPSDNLLINSTTTDQSVNITLPSTGLNLDIENENRTFKVTVPDIDVGLVPELNVSVRDINLSEIDNETLALGSSRRYRPVLGYAFSIDNEDDVNSTYTVAFNYSGLSVSYELTVFKLGYNFTSNTTEYNTSTIYVEDLDLSVSNNIASFTADSFSNFILAQDTSVPIPTGGSGGSGGGGGGSGGSHSLITVIPTLEGAPVTAPVNTIFNVIYEGHTYQVQFIFANGHYVKLKSLETGDYWTSVTGFPQKMDIDASGSDDMDVTLVDLNPRDATFVFTLLQGVRLRDIPPPATPTSRATQSAEQVPTTPTAPGPTTPTIPAITPTPEQPQPLPESPISLWAVLLGLLFIIVLVGGIAVYRRHLSMDKPPAAIRTGLGRPLSETELPPTTSEEPRSVPTLIPAPVEKKKESFIEKVEDTIKEDVEKVEHLFEKKESKPLQPDLQPEMLEHPEHKLSVSEEKVKILEKYLYHGLAEGFKPIQMRAVLLKKGWPEDVVDHVLDHIDYTDTHIESHDLHLHTEVKEAINPVKQLLENGFDEAHIREGLRRKGWKPEQIDDLFSKI